MHYDKLYASRPDHILWGAKPGRLLPRITEFLQQGSVLDAGCGDGKNALFLEQGGFTVHGFDRCATALEGLHHRFAEAGIEPKGRYEVAEVATVKLSKEYDLLLSYGLFHCLPRESRLTLHRRLQAAVKPGGLLFFTCLTATLPLPPEHGTDGITLVAAQEVAQLLQGWRVLYREEGTITEDHLPLVGKHQHSALWIIAQQD